METSLRLRVITTILFLQLLTLPTLHTNFCTGDSAAQVRCIQSERVALLEFKQDLQDPSHRLASWAVGDGDCCQWVGVVCHNVTGHVQELHLRSFPPVYDDGFMSDNELEAQYEAYWSDTSYNQAYERSIFGGKINPSLLHLKHLIYLDLSYNNFNGTQIPKFLGSMKRLRYLNLSNARFGGVIPHQLGNLSNLHYLNLGDINLYVMNLQWLSGLPLLQHLDMSFVNLSQASDWLPDINKLPSLLELRMSGCYLSGSTPSTPSINFSSLVTLDLSYNHFENTSNILWVFGLHNLVSLDLSGNQFQGPIPIDLQNMTSLRHLDLSWNIFNSSIPNWLYNFSHLEFLNLYYNHLQGTISSSIENLTSAISIDLSYNELGGKVPRSLGNLCNLREISLTRNKLSQEISELLESLSKCVLNGLESLELSNANLSGHLIDELGQFKNLVRLSLGYNSISGPIPESIGNLSSLRFLYLDGNQLNGTLPQSFGQLSRIETVYIHSNMLEGVVSEVHFANLTKLTDLVASQNRLTLEVRDDWIPPFKPVALFLGSWNLGLKFPSWLCAQNHLESLDISNSGILDTVPHSFWNLSSQFSYLNFSHNRIYGEIPNIPVILSTDSAVLDMSSNNFTGMLPCISSNVSVLDLSNNSLSGSISHFLCYKMNESKNMKFLNLGKNILSGKINNCWMMWKNLNVLNLGDNNFIGSIPTSIGSLIHLSYLHLHNNKFSAKLLSSLKNCKYLVTIDIAENAFVGSIPSWIGHRLSSLGILNLRSNNFHGYIPKGLCSLTSLQILDLSHNKLFGRIHRCVNNFNAMTTNHNSNYLFGLYQQGTRYMSVPFGSALFVIKGKQQYYMSVPFESVLLVIKGKFLEYSTTLQLVKIIDLSKNNLSGQIPKEVTSLQGLQSLNLSFNSLNGRILENIGDMGSLESIDFSVNQLLGQVPQSMSRCFESLELVEQPFDWENPFKHSATESRCVQFCWKQSFWTSTM